MEKTQAEIRAELYQVLEGLGAHPYLLATVDSWGDGLTDAEVLQFLRSWNDGTFRVAIISTGKTPRPARPVLRLVR
jgi:hypothetical protein